MDEEDEEILKQFEKEYENNNEIIDINKIEEPEITAEKKKDNKSIKDKEEDKIQPPNTTQPFNDLKIMKNDDPLKKLANNRFKTFEEIAQRAVDLAGENDLIITLGCGDIYKVIPMIEDGLGK